MAYKAIIVKLSRIAHATGSALQPFVLPGSSALLAPAFLLGLADEVPDLGGEAFALGRPHARWIPGDLLGGPLHLFAQFGAARLGFGIEVGDTGHLDEVFLRLLEARDGVALPGFRFPLATFFRFSLRLSRTLLLLSLRRTFSFGALGAYAIKAAALGVVEGRVLGPRAGQPFLELIEIFEVVAPGVKIDALPMAGHADISQMAVHSRCRQHEGEIDRHPLRLVHGGGIAIIDRRIILE